MNPRTKSILTMAAIGAGLGVFAWLNDLPRPSTASVDPMDDYIMFGIETGSADMIRYEFATGTLSSIGTVRDTAGNAYTGINAAAYIPGHLNVYGFWRDPADVQTKLLYINAQTGIASTVGADLGTDEIAGAEAVWTNNGWVVYAIQQPPLVDFEIEGGRVIPSTDFAVKVTVLGADISYAGQYEEPVTVKVNVGANTYEPFGPFDLALTGNVHDHTVHEFIIDATHTALDNVSVVGQNWIKKTGENGSHDDEWEVRNTVSSANDVPEVIVLRDGDPVPNITPFLDQAEIVDFIEDYVDFTDNTVDLGPNDAIYLFELGFGGASSSSADFQDLVVLVSVAGSVPEFTQGGTHGVLGGKINLNPNNNNNREFTLKKPDDTVVTRDDLHEDSPIDTNGVYYEGYATYVRVIPKGPGSQNELTIDGVSQEIQNSDLYTVTAQAMSVKVYNDGPDGGRAMGQWWIEFTSGEPGTVYEGEAPIDDGNDVHLVTIDHKTAVATPVMPLENRYDSLTSEDGMIFYGTSGSILYEINTVTSTETLVGVITDSAVNAMSYAGSQAMGFDSATDNMAPVNPTSSPLIGTPIPVGSVTDLGTMVFTTVDEDPAAISSGFD